MRCMVRGIACLTLYTLLAACRPQPPTQAAPSAVPAVHVAHRPPVPKDIIAAAIASQGVGLSVSTSCSNAGTEASDATIGRYLAGFLADMSKPVGQNWIETSIEPATGTGGEAIWICGMTIRHVDGDDRWGWGVRFSVRQSDGLVLANSFTCTGGG